MLGVNVALLASVGIFSSSSLKLLSSVGSELEALFLHEVKVLRVRYGSLQVRGMGEGTT